MISGEHMSNLFKEIRFAAQMNQEQLAAELGTTAGTLNRWENNKVVPTQMAQKSLYDFCKRKNIDLPGLIVKCCRYDSDEKLILYHGSKSGIKGQIAPISRAACDFGQGFYMGTDPLQPLTLICPQESPVFYSVELDTKGLKILDIDVGLDWAMLIAYNRDYMKGAEGTEIYQKYAEFAEGYDVIVGYIANDRMYAELTNFFDGTITDVALMKCLSALDIGKQYVAITEKACSQIKVLNEHKLLNIELMALRERSESRREEGRKLADAIVKEHRREGRFFDEILGGER